MTKTLRHFGPIRAILNQETKTAEITLPRRYGDKSTQLEPETVNRIIENWAKPWLDRMGYDAST